jgi:glycosyltransferase involved in cell wall biosynthesis
VQTYYVIITCRNSEKSIEEALLSVYNQSIKPEYVIVIDDGSTDKTSRILSNLKDKISSLYVITNPDLGYDIGRVVKNWNKAIQLTYDLDLEKTDYHMIATDDTVYEKNYVKKILKFLDNNQHVVIASGTYDNKFSTPLGAGRFINNKFFEKNQKFYPEIIGYESFILYAARYEGYNYAVVNNARFEHTRELGSDHNFYDWGQSMKALGYHPLFVLSRCIVYFLKDKPIGRMGPIIMLYNYLTYRPKEEGYYSLYQKDVRDYISNMQINQMKENIKNFLIKKLSIVPILNHTEKFSFSNPRTMKT